MTGGEGSQARTACGQTSANLTDRRKKRKREEEVKKEGKERDTGREAAKQTRRRRDDDEEEEVRRQREAGGRTEDREFCSAADGTFDTTQTHFLWGSSSSSSSVSADRVSFSPVLLVLHKSLSSLQTKNSSALNQVSAR